MKWNRNILWYLLAGLVVLTPVVPSWPAVVCTAVVALVAVALEALHVDLRRREVMGEELVSALAVLSAEQTATARTLEAVNNRLVTVENRTRPIGTR